MEHEKCGYSYACIYDSNSMQVVCVGLCLKSCQHHELSTCFSHTPTHIWQSHYRDQKHELTFQATLLRSYKVKESHRNVVLRDSCDFVAFMALLGYNKTLRLRPCELVQTAETGCSWRLQVPFRIFLILFSGCFIQSVMAAQCCDGLKRLWRVGQQLVFCKSCLLWENMCDHWQPLKVQLDQYNWDCCCGICFALIKRRAHPTVRSLRTAGELKDKTCCMTLTLLKSAFNFWHGNHSSMEFHCVVKGPLQWFRVGLL